MYYSGSDDIQSVFDCFLISFGIFHTNLADIFLTASEKLVVIVTLVLSSFTCRVHVNYSTIDYIMVRTMFVCSTIAEDVCLVVRLV